MKEEVGGLVPKLNTAAATCSKSLIFKDEAGCAVPDVHENASQCHFLSCSA